MSGLVIKTLVATGALFLLRGGRILNTTSLLTPFLEAPRLPKIQKGNLVFPIRFRFVSHSPNHLRITNLRITVLQGIGQAQETIAINSPNQGFEIPPNSETVQTFNINAPIFNILRKLNDITSGKDIFVIVQGIANGIQFKKKYPMDFSDQRSLGSINAMII